MRLSTCCLVLSLALAPLGAQSPFDADSGVTWHPCSTAMQLDLLPKDARCLECTRGDARFLELVSELPQLEGIRFTSECELGASSLRALSSAQKLRYLDLAGTNWEGLGGPLNAELIAAFKALAYLRVDLLIENKYWCGTDGLTEAERDRAIAEQMRTALAAFADFRGKGGILEIGRVSALAQAVAALREELPQLSSAALWRCDDGAAKEFSRFKDLSSLRIDGGEISELGMAFLARNQSIKRLSLREIELSVETLHHLGKFKNVERLEISGCPCNWDLAAFAKIASLAGLKHLTVDEMVWSSLVALDPEQRAKLRWGELESFSILRDNWLSGEFAAGMGFMIGARRLSVSVDQVATPNEKSPVSSKVQEMSLRMRQLGGEQIEEAAAVMADALARYTSLKKVAIAVAAPAEGFDAATWQAALKKLMPKVEVTVRRE
jgi:hypothetical protein